jgi:hypothetical protein
VVHGDAIFTTESASTRCGQPNIFLSRTEALRFRFDGTMDSIAAAIGAQFQSGKTVIN